MSATETAMSALERNWSMVDRALEDVDDDIMRDHPQCPVKLHGVAPISYDQDC